jgi:hypothetical protein
MHSAARMDSAAAAVAQERERDRKKDVRSRVSVLGRNENERGETEEN